MWLVEREGIACIVAWSEWSQDLCNPDDMADSSAWARSRPIMVFTRFHARHRRKKPKVL